MSTTTDIRIRLTSEQRRRLKNFAEAHGLSVSEYVRQKVFSHDFSLDIKLNEILTLLKKGSKEQLEWHKARQESRRKKQTPTTVRK